MRTHDRGADSMSKAACGDELDEQIEALVRNSGSVDPAEIVDVVESVMSTVSGDLSTVNQRLYGEIESLARFIHTAKAEIASMRPDEIKTEHLAAATDELEVIIGQTESATNSIFEAVETIEQLCEKMDAETSEAVTNAVTTVYEACGFQDLTGQRISKVVVALQHIEHKIEGLLEAFGHEFGRYAEAQDGDGSEAPTRRPGKADRPDEDLMNGPQKPGEGTTQDEIDALFD